MSKKRVYTWGKVWRACRAKGITVDNRGSEAKLLKTLPNGRKICHILSHKCCKSKNSVVWLDHIAAIKRKFGLTDADFD